MFAQSRTSALNEDLALTRRTTTLSSGRQSPQLPSTPPLAQRLPSMDDVWRRDNEMSRRIDRTLRDAEDHHRRVADLLAESRQQRATSLTAISDSLSSYSTLRGALGDSPLWESTRQPSYAPTWPRNPGPSTTGSIPRAPSYQSARSPHLSWTDTEAAPFPQNFGLSTTSSTPRNRPSDDLANADLFPSTASQRSMSDGLPAWQLEARSRARSAGLGGLRQRARPRASPSPPRSPWSLLTASFEEESSSRLFNLGSEASSRSSATRHSGRGTDFDYNTIEDRAAPWFGFGVPTPEFAEPNFPPSTEPTSVHQASSVQRPQRQSSIDLSAFRGGPFLDTMARSAALQQQRQAPSERSPVRPPQPSPPHWSQFDDDITAPFGQALPPDRPWPRHAQGQALPPDRPWPRHAQAAEPTSSQPYSSAISRLPMPPSSASTSSTDGFPYHGLGLRPSRDRGMQNSTDRLRDVLALPYGSSVPSRPTLLGRPRLTSGNNTTYPHSTRPSRTVDDERTTLAERHDQFERRREMRRNLPRTSDVAPRSAYNHTAAIPNLFTASRPLQTRANDAPAPSNATLLAARRIQVVPRPPDGSGEGRPAPLHGRFAARSRAGHLPPDMIWGDPRAAPNSRGRHRHLGDYMVSTIVFCVGVLCSKSV